MEANVLLKEHNVKLITEQDVKEMIDATEKLHDDPDCIINLAPIDYLWEYDSETRTTYTYKKFVRGKISQITSPREVAYMLYMLPTMCRVKYYLRRKNQSPEMANAYKVNYANLKTFISYEVKYLVKIGVLSSTDEIAKFYYDRITMRSRGLSFDCYDDMSLSLEDRYKA